LDEQDSKTAQFAAALLGKHKKLIKILLFVGHFKFKYCIVVKELRLQLKYTHE